MRISDVPPPDVRVASILAQVPELWGWLYFGESSLTETPYER